MTIGHAVQKGTLVYIYDANGRQLTSLSAPGRWPGDGLKGFTPNAVHIQKGTLLYAYDASGHQLGMPVPVRQGNVVGYIQTAKLHASRVMETSPGYSSEPHKAISA